MLPPTNHSLLTRPQIAVVTVAVSVFTVGAAEPADLFESRIRPLLAEHCYECHSTDKKQKAGLLLDSKAGWERGGDSGAPIVPGKPEDSLLLKAVRYLDKDLRMPPEKAGGKLTDGQIADLEAWIKGGAFDPRLAGTAPAAKKSWAEAYAERKQWWSLQPLRAVDLPPAAQGDAEWSAGAVDGWLLAGMKKEGILPSPKADAQTLIRRATLVLTGLPPSPTEVDAFVEASKRDGAGAYAALVDRLLA